MQGKLQFCYCYHPMMLNVVSNPEMNQSVIFFIDVHTLSIRHILIEFKIFH